MKKPKNEALLFLKEALKQFRIQGALFPSSKYLSRRVLKRVKMKKGIVVVELGAGTGVFTRMILDALPKDGRFIVVEINHVEAELLRRSFRDERVTVIEGDAAKLPEYLSGFLEAKGGQKFEARADCIVSGLPLGDFTRKERQAILSAIRDSLKDNGTYIQFQYLLASLLHIKELFRVRIVGYEIRNLPPAFLYECKKRGTIGE